MGFTQIRGFFSYSRADDRNNRLKEIHEDICAEYHALTGEDLELFFDRTDIKWGEAWREALSQGIQFSNFFIPVLSPCYFKSENCRTELIEFTSKANALGIKELILPIYYIDIERDFLELDDQLTSMVLDYQYSDWRELRNATRHSEWYSKKITELAEMLIKANKQIGMIAQEESDDQEVQVNLASKDENEQIFVMEAIENVTTFSEKLTYVLQKQTEEMKAIGEIAENGNAQIDEANSKSYGAKKIMGIMGQMGHKLSSVAERYKSYAIEGSELIREENPEMRAIIQFWKDNNISYEDVKDGVDGVVYMSETASETMDHLDFLINSIKPVMKLSRALYKPLKTIEEATITSKSAFSIVKEWGKLGNEIIEMDTNSDDV